MSLYRVVYVISWLFLHDRMLPIVDHLLDALNLEHTTFRIYAVTALLLLSVIVVLQTFLKVVLFVNTYIKNVQRLPPKRNWFLGHLGKAKWRRLFKGGSLSLDMFEHISLMKLDSLLKCTFSYDSDCKEKPSDYIAAIYEFSSLVVKHEHCPPHYFDFIYQFSSNGRKFRKACKIVHNFTADVVQQRKKALQEKGAEYWIKSKQEHRFH
ncbi:ultra-long-chain fatty acid omega-hydroxylase-like isoform X1 [Pyxicephalus adspersus]|uniref:ultra-long-chain fatty acid omega-hydroxylase-like isoform X1 n=1 Tax=Pyxicephalus adspersus TaxID=30357 RepID=UPI003B5AAF29